MIALYKGQVSEVHFLFDLENVSTSTVVFLGVGGGGGCLRTNTGKVVELSTIFGLHLLVE